MHQFNKPPAVVLDLGCGSGFWAIEAAKQWKVCHVDLSILEISFLIHPQSSTIFGFDIQDIQPRPCVLNLHKDLARRIKWVHGNLYVSYNTMIPEFYSDYVWWRFLGWMGFHSTQITLILCE
jgi:hypothetical protein